MLVTPAATAQLLTVRFTRVMLLAAVVGIASAVAGLYLSYWLDVASGATIVLVQTGAFLARARCSARGARSPVAGAPVGGGRPHDVGRRSATAAATSSRRSGRRATGSPSPGARSPG